MRRNAASKVGDFRQILRGDDYVGRLDIHVNDTVGMNVMQPGDNVLHETEQSTWRKGIGRGLDDFVQISFASILHDDVDGFRRRRTGALSQRHRQSAHDVGVFQVENLLLRGVTIAPITSTLVGTVDRLREFSR